MKIAVFTQQLEGTSGWGRYSLELATGLRAAGDDLVVFCERTNPAIDIPQYPLLPSPIALKRILLARLFYPSSFERALAERAFKPDVVHCFVEPYAPLAAALSGRTDAPLVVTVHGSYAVRPLASWFFGRLQRRAYRAARAIVCISSYTQKRLLSLEPNISTVVVPNGVRLPPMPEKQSPKDPLLLGVGALKERKGYRYVLEALPEIVRAVPDVRYVVVGNQDDAGYVRSLKQIIERSHLQTHVEFRERISDEALDALYRQARVLVLTPVSSPYSFEGFGLVYLEANARGVPVVGSFENGGEDAIVDGQTGYLSKPRDPHDIAQKVIQLLRCSDEAYAEMARRCRSWAQSHTWKGTVARYTDLYRSFVRV